MLMATPVYASVLENAVRFTANNYIVVPTVLTHVQDSSHVLFVILPD